jgi:hypothetical protein
MLTYVLHSTDLRPAHKWECIQLIDDAFWKVEERILAINGDDEDIAPA